MPEPQALAAPQAIAGHIYLVEDEAAVRRSLALLLELHGYATTEYGSAEEFLREPLPDAGPACALVDIRLPGMSGLALQARMVREERAPPVLLMTGHGDATLARTALLQGAIDFLEKPIDPIELFAAVEAALRADTGQRLARAADDKLRDGFASLTRRERELFDGITNGRHEREMAEQFGLLAAELEAQRMRLMEKLQARRLADLFRLRFRLDDRGLRR
jgi:two-component system response regulator FixJ